MKPKSYLTEPQGKIKNEKTRTQEELFIQLLEKADNLLTHLGGFPVHPSSAGLDAQLDDYIAFRWRSQNGSGHLIPVKHPSLVGLSDLIGIERQEKELDRNTRQFLQGLPANHVLLWGGPRHG